MKNGLNIFLNIVFNCKSAKAFLKEEGNFAAFTGSVSLGHHDSAVGETEQGTRTATRGFDAALAPLPFLFRGVRGVSGPHDPIIPKQCVPQQPDGVCLCVCIKIYALHIIFK